MADCRAGIPGGHYWLATGKSMGGCELHECQQCGDTCLLPVTWEAVRAGQGKGRRRGLNMELRFGSVPPGPDNVPWAYPKGAGRGHRRRPISLAVLGPGKG